MNQHKNQQNKHEKQSWQTDIHFLAMHNIYVFYVSFFGGVINVFVHSDTI